MKTYTTVIATIALTMVMSIAQAQLSGGFLGGMSFGKAEITNGTNAENGSTVLSGTTQGFQAGIYGMKEYRSIYFKSSIAYDYRYGQVSYNGVHTAYPRYYELHTLEVPVVLGVYVYNRFSLEAGPVYNRILNSYVFYNENYLHIGKDAVGYRIGANYNFNTVSINACFQDMHFMNKGTNSTYKESGRFIIGMTFEMSYLGKWRARNGSGSL